MGSRLHRANVALLLLFLSGCSQAPGPDADEGTEVGPTPGWMTNLTVTLPSSGVYVLPYYVASAVAYNNSITMDGGTWRGVRLDFVGQNGVAVGPPGGQVIGGQREWFEYRELARVVHEESARSVYDLVCMGNRTDDFCEPFHNPEQVPHRRDHWVDRPLESSGQAFPAGHNYAIIFAEFNKTFAWRFDFDEPVWFGNVVGSGEGVVLAPEYFRGDLVDMVRCYTIGWCGSLVGGRLSLDDSPREFLLLYAEVLRGAAVYGRSCLHADGKDPVCSEDRPLVLVRKLVHTVTFSGRPPAGLEYRLDIMGGAATGWTYNQTFGHSFTLDGEAVWFDLPEKHPGERAEVISGPGGQGMLLPSRGMGQ